MRKTTRDLTHAAAIAALYVVLTYLQNFLVPNSASMAIQFRVSEALCVLAIFTPSAVWGLSLGCFLFNLSYSAALPLDWFVGTAATVLATISMYWLRNVRIKKLPLLALLMPAVFNALLVGAELTIYIGEMSYWLNALYVAIGEAVVLLTLGTALYFALLPLQKKLFGGQ